jgi:tRNA (adenine37-N6)-methyltransferase
MRYRTILFFLLTIVFGTTDRSMSENYSMYPIGKVLKADGSTVLEVFPAYREALLGLDGFSHVIVLYWFDQNDTPEKRATLKVRPRRDERKPLTGVFATRSPVRPNLIGFSVCKIESVQAGRVTVDKIDAFDGTPLIDLKPYIPRSDCVPGASVPGWVPEE